MRKLLCAGIALALWVVPARAADDEIMAIIDKAIKAHGGADALKKVPAQSYKSKGKFYGMGGDGIEFTSTGAQEFPSRQRLEVEGTGFKFVMVVNGDKGWRAINGETEAMGKEELKESREGMHEGYLSRLTPLKGKDCKLSLLGEAKVEKSPAVGIRVECKGYRDVNLYFDKDSGLLVKAERRAIDRQMGDKEFTSEVYFGDYKKVEGRMVPYKVNIKRDGERYVESEVTEYTLAEKLDAKLFDKP